MGLERSGLIGTLRKKWSQNGASEEPFWKTAPLWQRGAIFFFIIMFRKKTVQISFL